MEQDGHGQEHRRPWRWESLHCGPPIGRFRGWVAVVAIKIAVQAPRGSPGGSGGGDVALVPLSQQHEHEHEEGGEQDPTCSFTILAMMN